MGSASCEGTGISESSFSSRTSLMFELLKSISYQRMVTHNKETIFTFLIYHMPCTY